MQVLTTRSSAGGDMGCTAEMGCGSEARIAATILAWLLPVKARLPEAISYNTAPSAKMSERASASFPSSCSGDMYWNVPSTMPCAVNGWPPEGPDSVMVRLDAGGCWAGVALANPKSISLAPDLVSMMLPGFRSR